MGKPSLSGICAVALGGLVAGLVSPVLARSPAEFYKGKNIDLIIGYSPGGGYDVYARVVGRHHRQAYPRQAEDRAASNARRRQPQGAGYVYNVAPRTARTLATADQSLALQQALEQPGAASSTPPSSTGSAM